MNSNQIQVGEPYTGSSVTIDDMMKTYGWVCVKCGRVYSPSTTMCLYCGGNNNVMPETTNTPTKREWWRDYCTITSDPSKLPKQELPITINDADTFCVHYDQLPYYTTITSWG